MTVIEVGRKKRKSENANVGNGNGSKVALPAVFMDPELVVNDN